MLVKQNLQHTNKSTIENHLETGQRTMWCTLIYVPSVRTLDYFSIISGGNVCL